MAHRNRSSQSAAIRARLTHQIIDVDGHTIEFDPGILDYLHQVGGQRIVASFQSWRFQFLHWYRLSPEERRRLRPTRISWWALPAKNTLDRATATLPKLRYERMEEIGIDFSIVYPTLGILIPHIEDEELRRTSCRAFNKFHADVYREHSYRLTPAAIIPMHTPEEAIEELEYCASSLGMKVAMCASYVRRPLAGTDTDPIRESVWFDTYGIDSVYDYDSVWAKCLELKIVPTFHSTGIGWGSRKSISNYIYNHIGSFAAVGEALCKSLFLGGVTRRFPKLRFVFLEGGIGWACSLYADLVGHWRKRNLKALENYNPENLNFELLRELYRQYGGKMTDGKISSLSKTSPSFAGLPEDPKLLDEWVRCEIADINDFRNLFESSFYFGCEADDRSNSWAFDTKVNPLGSRLKILLASDIGHWDVPDITQVVRDAYDLVEEGLITDNDFRDFTFANPVSCFGGVNPAFFKDTAVEKDASELLAEKRVFDGVVETSGENPRLPSSST